MTYDVYYEPRMDDPEVVAKFETQEEAKSYLNTIKENRPKAAPYHFIKNNTVEHGGPKGPEPTRFGTWENKGREVDF